VPLNDHLKDCIASFDTDHSRGDGVTVLSILERSKKDRRRTITTAKSEKERERGEN